MMTKTSAPAARTFGDLGSPISVPFSKICLDPNNPRIAPERASRYEDADDICNEDLQRDLTTKVYTVYQAEELEEAIIAQGWVPIDPIIVWRHPSRPDHYVVVEGNTRVSVLRNIRNIRLARERGKLEKFLKGKTPPEELKQQQERVTRLESIVKDTDKLLVYPVNAKTPDELEEKLPRLLGVRHIMHARQWGPYATNLYITSLYRRLFQDQYGDDEPLRLEQHLISRVAAMVSLGDTRTRRNIQSASAFDHFKRHYEDNLPEGEEFTVEDHYFFENILQNKYAQEQFGFSKDRLHLSDEAEVALFAWAFSKPRKGGDAKNQNTFQIAEDIRLWNAMSKYDSENGTGFASQFDVSKPETATKSMRLVEAEYLHQKARQTPLNTLQSLLEALKDLKGETMISQKNFLKPTLEQITDLTARYLRMMDADADADAA
jgi:hypothetical protein